MIWVHFLFPGKARLLRPTFRRALIFLALNHGLIGWIEKDDYFSAF